MNTNTDLRVEPEAISDPFCRLVVLSFVGIPPTATELRSLGHWLEPLAADFGLRFAFCVNIHAQAAKTSSFASSAIVGTPWGVNINSSFFTEFTKLKQNVLKIVSPFDEQSVIAATEHDVDLIKLSAGSKADWPLIEAVALAKKPVLAAVNVKDVQNSAPFRQFFLKRGIPLSFFLRLRQNFCVPNEFIISTPPACPPEDLLVGSSAALRQGVCGPSSRGDILSECLIDLSIEGSMLSVKQRLFSWFQNLLQIDEMQLQYDSEAIHASDYEDWPNEIKRGLMASREIKEGDRIDNKNSFLSLLCDSGQITAAHLSKYKVLYADTSILSGNPICQDDVLVTDIRGPQDTLVPDTVSVKSHFFSNVPCLVLRGGKTSTLQVIYVHGGGFVSGSAKDCLRIAMDLAAEVGCTVICPSYSLAPESPYPAAIQDVEKVYKTIHARLEDTDQLCLIGESAGGNLVLSLSMKLRDEGVSLPSGLICLSPWADLTNSSETHNPEMNSKDIFLLTEELNKNASEYAAGEEFTNPYISPRYGDMSNLPPLLLIVGGNEILLGDSKVIYERSRNAGVESTLQVFESMPHVFIKLPHIYPEAKNAFEEMVHFLKAL